MGVGGLGSGAAARDAAAYWLYFAGSLCFLAGTAVVL